MSDAMHMLDADNAALAAQLQVLQRDVTTARADILQLCRMLAGVQCINTIQEVAHLTTRRREIQARWGIKEVQP